MSRRVLAAFLTCQAVGELATWAASFPSMAGGPVLWVVSVMLLLPGDIAASWLVERFLWTGSLNLHQLQWFKVLCEVIINAVAWMLIAGIVKRIKRRSTNVTVP